MADDEEQFEVVDLGAASRNRYTQQILGDVTRQSAAKQVVIGVAAGWFCGYLLIKVGKIAACSLGTILLLIQIAQHQGYIQINWNRVNKEMERARRRVQQEGNGQYPNIADNLRRFAQNNMFLAGGFAAGFLIGITL